MSGKPKPKTYNCATCGTEHVNNAPKKVSRFCSRACTSRYQSVQFQRTRPELPTLSGRTKLIAGTIIVNEEYYEWLTIYKWRVSDNGYAVSQISGDGYGRNIRMHRLLMDAQPGQLVDHINRNKLDNRVENLRFSDKSKNSLNSERSDNAKLYTYDKARDKWAVFRRVNNKNVHYGRFNTEQEAKQKAIEVKRTYKMSEIIPRGDR